MTEKLKELPGAAPVIDALGGEACVAKMTRVTQKAVNNWKNWNVFPKGLYAKMLWELNKIGCTASPRLWQQMGTKGLRIRRVGQ